MKFKYKTAYLFVPLILYVLLMLFVTSPKYNRVAEVIDGDTIILENGERVRYIGMDTPELPSQSGLEAKKFNEQLVEGERVRLEKDTSNRDRYGRLLRYVYNDGEMINKRLLKEDMAEVAIYPPDTEKASEFRQITSQ